MNIALVYERSDHSTCIVLFNCNKNPLMQIRYNAHLIVEAIELEK